MNHEMRKIIIKELKMIGIVFILFYLMFQIHYYKENLFTILKIVLAHFYLFIIPGYSLCLILYDKVERLDRLVLGIGIGYGLQPFLLYAINDITRINVMRYNIYVSGALIIIGVLMFKYIILDKK
ncbi:MAG: hypothetical protein AABW88_05535 [Nanoarchaeota archaeon]